MFEKGTLVKVSGYGRYRGTIGRAMLSIRHDGKDYVSLRVIRTNQNSEGMLLWFKQDELSLVKDTKPKQPPISYWK